MTRASSGSTPVTPAARAGVGQLERLEARQAAEPEALGARDVLGALVELLRDRRVERQQRAGAELLADHVAELDRPAARRREPGDAQHPAAAGDVHALGAGAEHGPGRRVVLFVVRTRRGHDQDALLGEQLGARQRVVVAPEVERAHEGLELARRARPVERAERRGLGVPSEVAALRRVLRRARLAARGELVDQLAEGLEPGLETLRVERQRRLVRRDLDRARLEHVALVHARRHDVPGDAVPRLARHQRPGRRVEPRVARQRPVVEVDRGLLRQREQLLGQDREVRDAEEEVERLRAQRVDVVRVVHGDPVPARPLGHARRPRQHAGQLVPTREEQVPAGDEQRVGADQEEAKGGVRGHAGRWRGRKTSRAGGPRGRTVRVGRGRRGGRFGALYRPLPGAVSNASRGNDFRLPARRAALRLRWPFPTP